MRSEHRQFRVLVLIAEKHTQLVIRDCETQLLLRSLNLINVIAHRVHQDERLLQT